MEPCFYGQTMRELVGREDDISLDWSEQWALPYIEELGYLPAPGIEQSPHLRVLLSPDCHEVALWRDEVASVLRWTTTAERNAWLDALRIMRPAHSGVQRRVREALSLDG
jgi:hypothetical protein